MTKKKAAAVSIIGGDDGPTSFFLTEKSRTAGRWDRIKKYFYKRKWTRAERGIEAHPHTLDEVIRYIEDTYGAVEVSEESFNYTEQRKGMKEYLIIKYRPELLGDIMAVPQIEDYDESSLKEFWAQFDEYNRKREELVRGIPDDVFPMDFHIYKVKAAKTGEIQFAIEKKWKKFECSYSGSRKDMKICRKIWKEIYMYYGATEEDIRDKSERYSELVTVLIR